MNRSSWIRHMQNPEFCTFSIWNLAKCLPESQIPLRNSLMWHTSIFDFKTCIVAVKHHSVIRLSIIRQSVISRFANIQSPFHIPPFHHSAICHYTILETTNPSFDILHFHIRQAVIRHSEFGKFRSNMQMRLSNSIQLVSLSKNCVTPVSVLAVWTTYGALLWGHPCRVIRCNVGKKVVPYPTSAERAMSTSW